MTNQKNDTLVMPVDWGLPPDRRHIPPGMKGKKIVPAT
jgi:hypothetical protein